MADIGTLKYFVELIGGKKTEDGLDKIGDAADKSEKKTKGLTGALKELSGIGGPIGNLASKFDDLSGKVGAAGRAATALGISLSGVAIAGAAAGAALVVVAGAGGIVAGLSFAGPLDDINDMAERLGYTASQMALLQGQMAASGTSIETYTAGIQRIANALSKSDEEGKAAAEALKTLGVNVTATTNPTELAATLTEKYAKKLKDGSINVDEMAALQLVLGKNYREVIVAIDAHNKAIDKQNKFYALNIGISSDGVKAAGDFEEAQLNLSYIFQVVGSQLVGEVVPAFTVLIEHMVESYKSGGAVAGVFDLIRLAAQAVMIPIRLLINTFIALETTLTVIGKGIGAIFAAIATKSTQPIKDADKEIGELIANAQKRIKEVGLLGGFVSGDIQAPSKNQFKTTSSTTKVKKDREAEKELKEQIGLLEKFAGLYQDQTDSLNKALGIDTERVKVEREAEELANKIKGLTEGQRKAMVENVTAAYDRRKLAEDNKKLEEETTKEYEKQFDAVNSVMIKSNQALQKMQQSFDQRFFTKAQKSEFERISAATNPILDLIDSYTARLNDPKLPEAFKRGLQQNIDLLYKQFAVTFEKAVEASNMITQSQEDIQEGVKKGMVLYFDTLPTMAEGVSGIVSNTFKSMEEALFNLATTGKMNFKSLIQVMLQQITRLIIQLHVLKPLMGMLGVGSLGGGTPAGVGVGDAGWGADIGVAAKGGAWNRGTQFFAAGGVVSAATAFGMAGGKMGVMGEAGPEAIMPLKRDSKGNLGIVAQGGGGGLNIGSINISVQGGQTNDETGKVVSQAVVNAMRGIARSEISSARRTGGILNPV